MRYDVNKPVIVTETMALKATVEPTLIRPMSAVITVQKPTERRGIAEDLLT